MRNVKLVLIFSVLTASLLGAGCGATLETPAVPAPTAAATLLAATPTYMPIPSPVPDTGWQALSAGLERRIVQLFDDQGARRERLYMLRLEPQQFVFKVAYSPQPRTLQEWQAETGALLLVNGGYFRLEGEQNIPTGLTVVDGQAMGISYGNFAGMLAVTEEGPELRWLARQPYDPAEPLRAALQCFPILIKPGGELGFGAENEDNQAARRTVVARDRQGRFLFIVAQVGFFSLHQFSAYLAGSDLELDMALNLDGGPSSGLLLADPREEAPAFIPLPVVIAVSRR